jgi:hypothetical protein
VIFVFFVVNKKPDVNVSLFYHEEHEAARRKILNLFIFTFVIFVFFVVNKKPDVNVSLFYHEEHEAARR